MISSVTFPIDGKGYIYSKYAKPIKPDKSDRRTYYNFSRGMSETTVFNQERYDKDMLDYKEEMKRYRSRKSDYALPCAGLLIGRTFKFEAGKINVIFGPNGSGKTTIMRAMAGEALTSDGFTKLLDPLSIGNYTFSDMVDRTDSDVKQAVTRMKMNTATVEWDGAPVYYHNFDSTIEKGHDELGKLEGSVLSDFEDELTYRMVIEKGVSLGQKSVFFINKLIAIAGQRKSMAEMMLPYKELIKNSCNDTWAAAYNAQIGWLKSHPKYDSKEPLTMLFDEIDKSLDIETVWRLYSMVLPEIVKRTGVQIIIITHSPLVLTDAIYGNDIYNIVPTDEDYMKEVKAMLDGVKF